MHRNYQTNAPAKFYEYSDRIEMDNPGGLYGKVQPENFPNTNDYRNPIIAEAMKVLGYVNRFNRGVNMVQEILEENKNGDAIFDFKDISTFKVTVMSADPKPEGDTENGTGKSRDDIENGADGIENNNNGIESSIDNGIDGTEDGIEKTTGREAEIIAIIKGNNRISKKTIAEILGIGTTSVSRYIDSLKTKGVIERIGGDRGGYWKIK
jgi:ATP-dependent DNA helicase RecG